MTVLLSSGVYTMEQCQPTLNAYQPTSEDAAETRRLRQAADLKAVREAAAEAAVAATARLDGRSPRKAVQRLRAARAREEAVARQGRERELRART